MLMTCVCVLGSCTMCSPIYCLGKEDVEAPRVICSVPVADSLDCETSGFDLGFRLKNFWIISKVNKCSYHCYVISKPSLKEKIFVKAERQRASWSNVGRF